MRAGTVCSGRFGCGISVSLSLTGCRRVVNMNEGNNVTVKTQEGRRLSGRAYGPRDGDPVLFIAGAGMGKSMLFGEEVLPQHGIRVLTMDRPGMGASDPEPNRTMTGTAEDYRIFTQALLGTGAASVPVVANSQGGMFGLALAALGFAAALVLVSPADEVQYPAVHDKLSPQATQLSDLAVSSPDSARKILQDFSAKSMEDMVIGGSTAKDAEFYTSEPFLTRYRRALSEGFAHEGVGYVQDTMLAMRPWNIDMTQVRCPVSILFGEDDKVHSPDHGLVLQSRLETATRRLFPGEGGSLLWTRAGDVLDIVHALAE